MMNNYVIELEHVTVYYRELVALEDVTLRVTSGEFLALIGPNGSGKTTLLKTILGLVSPVAGAVRLFGEPPRAVQF
jgi:zinc transport system ATP-binding protein